MFLDEKTVLEIWLNPGLNLTIFQETGRRVFVSLFIRNRVCGACTCLKRIWDACQTCTGEISLPFKVCKFVVKLPGGGALAYFSGGYVPPGTPNWHPVVKKNSPEIDTPF